VTGGSPTTGAVLGGAAGAAAGILTDEDDLDLGEPIWRR
jgi:osmotically inducible lipoprotein OsmB